MDRYKIKCIYGKLWIDQEKAKYIGIGPGMKVLGVDHVWITESQICIRDKVDHKTG